MRSAYYILKYSSALYIGMAKVLPIIDVLGYDGQSSSFFNIIITASWHIYTIFLHMYACVHYVGMYLEETGVAEGLEGGLAVFP